MLVLSSVAHAQPAGTPSEGAAAAQVSPPASGDPPIVVEAQKEKKVCRSETATGSIMPRRVCKTATQIAREQVEAERALEAARALQETTAMTRELREAGAL